jgi:hypothetical protein
MLDYRVRDRFGLYEVRCRVPSVEQLSDRLVPTFFSISRRTTAISPPSASRGILS